ncbi:hypothetical protein FACS189432_06580 [Bacteroidia bacterium]|nr:hypothetical protein FACS189432_06580 [Bacteroidia bacterium]
MGNAITELIKNRKMETDEQIESFEQALDSIFSRRDFNDFDNLIKGFDDGTENKEVMFSLVHAVEYFAEKISTQEYVAKILSCLKLMNPHALDWADILILRIINNDDYYASLQESVIKNKAYDTGVLKLILNHLIERNPKRFSERCNHILSLIARVYEVEF